MRCTVSSKWSMASWDARRYHLDIGPGGMSGRSCFYFLRVADLLHVGQWCCHTESSVKSAVYSEPYSESGRINSPRVHISPKLTTLIS